MAVVIFDNPFIDESVVFEGFEIIEDIVAVKLCIILGSSLCPQSVFSTRAIFSCRLTVFHTLYCLAYIIRLFVIFYGVVHSTPDLRSMVVHSNPGWPATPPRCDGYLTI